MKRFLNYLLSITILLISIIACESDFDNVGVDLVDNNTFDTEKATYEVNAYTKNIIRSRAENTPEAPIGVYNRNEFGIFRGNLASQLVLPSSTDFGLNATVDAVVIDIPYDATRLEEDQTGGLPNFQLNEVYGDHQSSSFTFKVFKLGTFLNSLDPADPTQFNEYYSDKTYNKLDELYSNTNFTFNPDDTVFYVDRLDFPDAIRDTIKRDDVSPSLKLQLDNNYFQTNFINNSGTSVLENQDNFNVFFNGLYFESTGINGSLMMLNMSAASLTIYYSNDVLTDETVGSIVQDLNNDGDTDDTDVPVRTKQNMVFTLNGIRASNYDRDYSGSDANNALDNTAISDKIYIQGAAGSIADIDAFVNVDLNAVRNENWLINEADIVCYIENDIDNTIPDRLFLYRLDDNNNGNNEDIQITDIISEGEAVYDGVLQNDDDENPIKYRFRITDYVSEILKNEDPLEPVRLGIKTYHVSDLPNINNSADIIVREFSWDPKGVVIYGNDIPASDTNYDKRLKLEIYYTKLN